MISVYLYAAGFVVVTLVCGVIVSFLAQDNATTARDYFYRLLLLSCLIAFFTVIGVNIGIKHCKPEPKDNSSTEAIEQ